jgi:metal-dependent amidase/aminoacylase/carboxypeptidase family protein
MTYNSRRNELYTDIKINSTLCERYAAHMGSYGRGVLAQHEKVLTGSSDIGNVSYVVPTLHTMFGLPDADGIFPHHASFAAAAGTDSSHEEAVVVGKSLALIGWEMVNDQAALEQVRSDFREAIKE